MSTSSGNGLLPRQHSALLPPPIQETETAGPASRRSPRRNEYQAETQGQELQSFPQPKTHPRPALRMVEEGPHEPSRQPRTPNPKIMVNDQVHDITDLQSPVEKDTNFETISLHDENGVQSGQGESRGSVDPAKSPQNFSRPREGNVVTPTQRPSVIVTDGSLPQLQLQFALPPSQSQNSVSVYDDDEGVDVNSPSERQPMNPSKGFQDHDPKKSIATVGNREVQSVEEYGQDMGGDIPKENVKGMIQEWEKVHGRFGRDY